MSFISQLSALRAVGLSASPSGATSRSRLLLERALARLRTFSIETALLDLATLPADALLGRARDARVDAATAAVASAHLVVVATPVYRASYSGLLKVFMDLLDERALVDKVAVPIASGGGPGHLLAIDHGLRPLLSSLGATVISGGVYAAPSSFLRDAPSPDLLERIDHSLTEAVSLAVATSARLESLPFEKVNHHARIS
jgi:FMN reductase